MNEPRGDAAQTLIRFGKALAIHLLIAALGVGLIFLVTSHYDDASLTLRAQFAEAEDAQSAIAAILDQTRILLVKWMLLSLLVSFLLTGLFLSAAQARHPRNVTEGASRKPLWIGLLLIALIACTVFWWQQVSLSAISTSLTSGGYVVALSAGGLGTLLAYYFGTALTVVATMKPSVPLAGLLPGFWN